MRIKAPIRYMLTDILRGVAVLYGVFIVIHILLFTSIAIGGFSGTFNGIEFTSLIFLFVMGLNAFTSYFGMLLQNGVSRKTMFTSRLMVFAIVAAVMALCNMLLIGLLQLIPSGGMTISVSLFSLLYPTRGVGGFVLNFLFSFVLGFFLLNIGAFIVTMFYRLPKWGKPLVGAGVPVFLIMVLPTLDRVFFGGGLTRLLVRAMDACFGFSAGQPWLAVVSLLVLSAVFIVFGWMLTRKATFRK